MLVVLRVYVRSVCVRARVCMCVICVREWMIVLVAYTYSVVCLTKKKLKKLNTDI